MKHVINQMIIIICMMSAHAIYAQCNDHTVEVLETFTETDGIINGEIILVFSDVGSGVTNIDMQSDSALPPFTGATSSPDGDTTFYPIPYSYSCSDGVFPFEGLMVSFIADDLDNNNCDTTIIIVLSSESSCSQMVPNGTISLGSEQQVGNIIEDLYDGEGPIVLNSDGTVTAFSSSEGYFVCELIGETWSPIGSEIFTDSPVEELFISGDGNTVFANISGEVGSALCSYRNGNGFETNTLATQTSGVIQIFDITSDASYILFQSSVDNFGTIGTSCGSLQNGGLVETEVNINQLTGAFFGGVVEGFLSDNGQYFCVSDGISERTSFYSRAGEAVSTFDGIVTSASGDLTSCLVLDDLETFGGFISIWDGDQTFYESQRLELEELESYSFTADGSACIGVEDGDLSLASFEIVDGIVEITGQEVEIEGFGSFDFVNFGSEGDRFVINDPIEDNLFIFELESSIEQEQCLEFIISTQPTCQSPQSVIEFPNIDLESLDSLNIFDAEGIPFMNFFVDNVSLAVIGEFPPGVYTGTIMDPNAACQGEIEFEILEPVDDGSLSFTIDATAATCDNDTTILCFTDFGFPLSEGVSLQGGFSVDGPSQPELILLTKEIAGGEGDIGRDGEVVTRTIQRYGIQDILESGLYSFSITDPITGCTSTANLEVFEPTDENGDPCTTDQPCDVIELTSFDDDFTACPGESIIIEEATLLANDMASNGAQLIIQDLILADTSQATLVNNNDGTWTLTPGADFTDDIFLFYTAIIDNGSLVFVENGHLYEFIEAPEITWQEAREAASSMSINGLQGYLATITSQSENDFISERVRGAGWIGGSDDAEEGEWRWVTGPEMGQQFWQGDENGSAFEGAFANWIEGNEPNNQNDEDFAHIFDNGSWNDWPNFFPAIEGYVVEYGGIEECNTQFSIPGQIRVSLSTECESREECIGLSIRQANCDFPSVDVEAFTIDEETIEGSLVDENGNSVDFEVVDVGVDFFPVFRFEPIPGTYTAVVFSPELGCQSEITFEVFAATDENGDPCQPEEEGDCDQDGVADADDLDNDNDGLLDSVECRTAIDYSETVFGPSEITILTDLGQVVNVSVGSMVTDDALFGLGFPNSFNLDRGVENVNEFVIDFPFAVKDLRITAIDFDSDSFGDPTEWMDNFSVFPTEVIGEEVRLFASGEGFGQGEEQVIFNGMGISQAITNGFMQLIWTDLPDGTTSISWNNNRTTMDLDINFQIDLICFDTDGDGDADRKDPDSDGDGCVDAEEAGHSDPDNDGILGISPIEVDVFGRVVDQGGYTGLTTEVLEFDESCPMEEPCTELIVTIETVPATCEDSTTVIFFDVEPELFGAFTFTVDGPSQPELLTSIPDEGPVSFLISDILDSGLYTFTFTNPDGCTGNVAYEVVDPVNPDSTPCDPVEQGCIDFDVFQPTCEIILTGIRLVNLDEESVEATVVDESGIAVDFEIIDAGVDFLPEIRGNFPPGIYTVSVLGAEIECADEITFEVFEPVDENGNPCETPEGCDCGSDTTPPVFDDFEVGIVADCGELTIEQLGISATDSCSEVTITFEDFFFSPGCLGTLQRTYTATDECGNSSTAVQIIDLTNESGPMIECPADVTVECIDEVPEVTEPTVSHGCSNIEITSLELTETQDTTGCIITISRTWTAEDECGGTSSCTQTITVADTQAPEVPVAPAGTTVQCADEVGEAPTLTATDNCDGTIEGELEENIENGDCPNSFTLTRTWTFTDVCGNSSSVSQMITVDDTEAPIPPDAPEPVSVSCVDEVPNAVVLTAMDLCDGPIDAAPTTEILPGDCPNSFMMTRTWTFTDSCGNSYSYGRVWQFIYSN